MLSENQKIQLRSTIFCHLDGIVTAPTAFVLHSKGVADYIIKNRIVDVGDLARQFQANEGYLNVALHTLASQGWLMQNISDDGNEVSYKITEKGENALPEFGMYGEVWHLLKFTEHFHPRVFQVEPFRIWEKALKNYKQYVSSVISEPVKSQILKHIEGVLIGPSIVHLAMNGMFHKYFMEASFKPDEYHKHPEYFEVILDFFTELGWFRKSNGTYRFTETGIFFARRATAYGVTVSYIPTLRALDELIFGNPEILKQQKPGGKELHVDREMNVWGSGGAHSTYFEAVDKILIDIFNKPIEEQPKGLLDMGCGNGAFLIHAFDVIERQTLRGKLLEDYPLILVGADFNNEALRVSRANLIQADVWAKFVHADIGRPDLLAETLKTDYNIELGDLLNFRSFIDHNRLWKSPQETHSFDIAVSSGAYAYKGQRVNNRQVESSLYEHLKLWQPYISKHGLLIIELHTIDPALAAANLGKTAVTAYDATHGYSDQYIIELESFRKIAESLGLNSVDNYAKKFPDNKLATVSIQLYRS